MSKHLFELMQQQSIATDNFLPNKKEIEFSSKQFAKNLIESGEIDKIVDMVKKQDIIDNSELTEYLIKKLHITDIQAGYILSSTIQQLSKGHLKLYKKEFAELSKAIPIYSSDLMENDI